MAYDNSKVCISLNAGGDLSAAQYLFVDMAADGEIDAVSGAGAKAVGVLQTDPGAQGRAGEVCISGVTKVVAGGTIAAGAQVASNASGEAVAASTGNIVLGTALEAADSGDIIPMIFNPGNVAP